MHPRLSAVVVSVVLSVLVFSEICHGEAGARSARTNSFARKGAVRFAAGGEHNCMANGDGTVSCWGRNNLGQLGNNTTSDSQSPVTVTTLSNGIAVSLSNAIAVTAGEHHSCALLADSSVRCWGGNEIGQLGNGNTTQQLTAVSVTGLSSVVALSSGSFHTCAVLADGTVSCWGGNSSGQLGFVGSGSRTTPFAVTLPSATVVDVVGGAAHTCALKANGDALCWGKNTVGQLGTGQTNDGPRGPSTVTGLHNAVALTAGLLHTCALLGDGTAQCWGNNDSGQIGDNTFLDRLQPTPVFGVAGAVSLTSTSTGDHTCAVLATGAVRCWGANGFGQLGNGNTTDQPTPVTVINLPRVAAIAAGRTHTCSLLSTGIARCWGATLAAGGIYANGVPTTVLLQAGIGAEQVRAGANHNCALRLNGQTSCWGDNASGQLGNGSTTPSSAPVSTIIPANVLAIASGSSASYSCALLDDGTVRCWGANGSGQLGDGSTAPQSQPVTVSGLSNVTAIAMGSEHTCALLADGTVSCWGKDGSGQLGDGKTKDQAHPVAVKNITNAIALAAGDNFACALLADGTVQCWGDNAAGQLGDGSTTPRGAAAPVTQLTNAVAIAAGPLHVCAVAVGVPGLLGSPVTVLRCWGDDSFGQLGNGLQGPGTFLATPFTVSGISNPTGVTAGAGHTCALISTGIVRCLGKNVSGQLGDGSIVTKLSPVTVSTLATSLHGTFRVSLTNLTSITAGANHTCALRSDGEPLCWGDGILTPTELPSFTFNIDPAVLLSDSGRVSIVTVLAACPQGESFHVQLNLRQGPAVGQGVGEGACTGGLTRLPVTVPANGPSGFGLGPAKAEANGLIRNFGAVVEAPQWARDVNLVPQTH